MRKSIFIGLTWFALGVWAQAPKITGFTTGVPGDTTYGPGTFLIIFGTFAHPSAGRDYTITAGGQTSGINVAANAVFIAANIPSNAAPGPTNLVITYLGQASNPLPITIAPVAPAIQGVSYTVGGATDPPGITFVPFRDAANYQAAVTPASPAAIGQALQIHVTGLGSNLAPAVAPQVTVAGQNATILQADPGTGTGTGNETIYFTVPRTAPNGIDPVVVTVAGTPSMPYSLPVGTGPAVGQVLNGASFGSAGVVAPGAIVSVFGAGFGSQNNLSAFPNTSVNGVSVLFGATAAPIFALAGPGGQINVLVPTELPSTGTVDLSVQTPGGASAPQTLTLAPAAPGIFYYGDPLVPSRRNAVAVTANTAWIAMPLSLAASLGVPATCGGPAVLCAQPAKRGGYLQIYVTGLGKATPNGDPNGAALATGSVAPAGGSPLYQTVAAPVVLIGGQNAPVLFSGVAPGYNGLYQVDVQIPANIAAGDDVPLQLSIAGVSDSATLAIQ